MADDSFDWKLDGSGFGQSSATSCWYAIVHTKKGTPTTAIREKIEKAGLDYTDYWNNGLPPDDFPKTRAALGMVGWRGAFAYSQIDDFAAMVQMLKGYGPLWCAFVKPSPHSGVDSNLGQVHILNPWNNTNGNDADSQYLTTPVFKGRLNTTAMSVLQGFM